MTRISNRKNETREQYSSFLIICAEGKNSKTEENYFNGIKKELHNMRYPARILVKPSNILDIDIFLKSNMEYSKQWIVIDKDQIDLKSFIDKNKHKCKIAFSNLCFEYWLLLHFEDSSPTSLFNCEKYNIAKYIKNYKKNDPEIYVKVKNGELEAMERAKKNLNIHKESQKDIDCWLSSTNMFELIEEIRKAQELYEKRK